MAFRVVVLRQGGTDVLHTWLDRESAPGLDRANWEEVAWRCVRSAVAGPWRDVDVFVCLLGDHMTERAESDLARRVVSLAHHHCWGGAVYLTLDRKIALGDVHREYAPSFSEWFRAAAGSGIAGVVQVPMAPTRATADAVLARDLSGAAATARSRHETLRPLAGTRTWRLVTPRAGGVRGDFLAASFPSAGLLQPADGVVALIESPNAQAQQFRRIAEQFPGRALVAATAQAWGTQALRDECDLHSAQLLVHHGLFELRYSLQVLNDSPRVQAAGWNAGEYAVALVTSGFSPRDGQFVLHAAREVGELTRCCAPWMDPRVHPAVSCERLVDVLTDLARLSADVRVWTYSGHGGGADGLEEADTRGFCAPERWAKAFEGRRFPDLVLLLACRSTPTAKLFGARGSLAVGFDCDVISKTARILAAEVLEAAARSGFDPRMIRGAFEAGRARLTAAGDDASKARLFPEI